MTTSERPVDLLWRLRDVVRKYVREKENTAAPDYVYRANLVSQMRELIKKLSHDAG
jgi:hypothetical protein